MNSIARDELVTVGHDYVQSLMAYYLVAMVPYSPLGLLDARAALATVGGALDGSGDSGHVLLQCQ